MNEIYKHIVDVSPDFITLIGLDYHYKMVNPAYCSIVGKKSNEIIGRHIEDVWESEKFHFITKENLDRCLKGAEIHYINEFKFGLGVKYMHVSYFPYRDEKNEISNALIFFHDMTKLGKIESKLANFEFKDPVTGLFNKKSLDLIVEMELDKAKRSKSEQIRAICIIRIKNLN